MEVPRSFLSGLIVLIGVLGFAGAGCGRSSVSPELRGVLPATVDYNFHVKPILSDRCYTCHGPDPNTREADLRLDVPEGFSTPLGDGGDRYPVVPRRPGRSELIRRITHTDPDEVMPPSESNLTLTELEKALLRRWVEQGAEWKPHWSFTPPVKPNAPDGFVRPATYENEIDAFVQARLEQHGLSPNPKARRDLLLRRVTFDLTGLPPTLEEIDAFLADTASHAYERVVNRLLASDAYGERMAAVWLDAARYADTGGYQSDRLRRMWPWRDWVVEAYNRNLPYNTFVTWQLAGDLLPDATKEQQLATAFNRNHRQTEEGGSIEEEFRTEYVADRVQTTATALLGLTMECARCHDHKYDPISQKDYYRFFAFFNNIDESGQTSFFTDAVPVPTLLLSSEEQDREIEPLNRRIEQVEKRLETLRSAPGPAFEAWLERQTPRSFPPVPEKGLTAHLPFDELTAGADRTTTPNTADPDQPGASVFDPKLTEGRIGGALVFDGENGIDVEGAGRFTRSSPFTVGFWIQARAWNPWNVLVHRTKAALDAGSRGYEVALQHNRVVVGMAHMWPQNALRIVSEDTLRLNAWHHVTFTYDGSGRSSGLTLYIDGRPSPAEVVRDNLFKNITYERQNVPLTVGYRFRDSGFKDGRIDELRVYDRQLTAWEVAQLAGSVPFDDYFATPPAERTHSEREPLRAYYLAHHDSTYGALLRSLETLRARRNALIDPIEEVMVMKEMDEPRPAYVLIRGAYDNKGEEVSPGTPASILAFPDALPANRLGLSQWLFSDANPLTARVAVNRYWQTLFGRGLVATPEDFGNQGALPSHPALLDWLAVTFRESGWDTRALLKKIVMSHTYRQASEADSLKRALDPSNELLGRGPRNRLSAEMIRDHALAASGLLVHRTGGPPVKPYQPAGLWEEKSGAPYEPDSGEGLYRRSVYTFWKRTSPPPSMIAFDAARRNQCIVRRQSTNTPMQALVLLNDPQFIEAARVLAERSYQEAGASTGDRLSYMFRLSTGRLPTPDEAAVLHDTFQEQRSLFAAPADEGPANAAQPLLSVGEKPAAPDIPPDELASYTIVASLILNLDATIVKR